MADIIPYNQPYPIRYPITPLIKVDSSCTPIEKAFKWASENPEIVAAAGLGLFVFGVYLSTRKANKAN